MLTDDDLIKALNTALKTSASQEEIAALAGMSQGHLSKIAAQKVRLTGKARRKLIDALNLSGEDEPGSIDSVTKLTEELQALPAGMREPIGSALLAALDVLMRFRQAEEPGESRAPRSP